MITLAFYNGEGDWFDKLIHWWTCGAYSHVELVVGDPETWPGEVIILSSSPRDGGVREKRLALDPKHWTLVTVPGDADHAAMFIRGWIGARYDWLGIVLSQVIPIDWHWSNRWFCSEICAAALGIPEPQRMSPSGLHRYLTKARPESRAFS
ncbi:hypothetical protein GCM10007989_24380 [Devosia pacifica]|uniref:Enoyl-CoA hydratase n=1 Tax=Devosia pacifica TaxID=1335967 RepID=A0A918S9H0_9HYPH|nr:hypothetical protein [Devosia pacifica]GHA27634.1 hypothetical protein GCM10007989_24380 [Devosia pacifica]